MSAVQVDAAEQVLGGGSRNGDVGQVFSEAGVVVVVAGSRVRVER